MGAIWSEENKLTKWLDIELAALEALAKYGYIPKGVPAKVCPKASFDIKRVQEIENVVHHDVIAFITNVEERVGKEGRYIHYGLTSSDVLDTGLAVQIQEASRILLSQTDKLLTSIKKLARKHRWTLMIGRSHGVHAEPVTFGLKMAVFYEEIRRGKERLKYATQDIAVGKISGAVGTFANVDPRVEAYVCRKLKLSADLASTQIVQRDRHAAYLTSIALLGSSLEKLATEIRHLQRTEVLEAEESFGSLQKGSSAMPHKKNPIRCERVAGLARLLRGNALAAMENVSLWHERDITHSSVERVIFPDSTITLDYMLSLSIQVIDTLVVHKKNMITNLEKGRGMVFSQRLLLELIGCGVSRDKAYRMVQRNAKKVWDEGLNLKDCILQDAEVCKLLGDDKVAKVFDYKYHLKNIDKIFKRVGI